MPAKERINNGGGSAPAKRARVAKEKINPKIRPLENGKRKLIRPPLTRQGQDSQDVRTWGRDQIEKKVPPKE